MYGILSHKIDDIQIAESTILAEVLLVLQKRVLRDKYVFDEKFIVESS